MKKYTPYKKYYIDLIDTDADAVLTSFEVEKAKCQKDAIRQFAKHIFQVLHYSNLADEEKEDIRDYYKYVCNADKLKEAGLCEIEMSDWLVENTKQIVIKVKTFEADEYLK